MSNPALTRFKNAAGVLQLTGDLTQREASQLKQYTPAQSALNELTTPGLTSEEAQAYTKALGVMLLRGRDDAELPEVVATILEAVDPQAAQRYRGVMAESLRDIARGNVDPALIERAFDNVESWFRADQTLDDVNLKAVSRAWVDSLRDFGSAVGDRIKDFWLEGFKSNPRTGTEETVRLPSLVEGGNLTGEFASIKLSQLEVKDVDGRDATLEELIRDPSRIRPDWNAGSLASPIDDGVTKVRGLTQIVPVADGAETEIVGKAYTYGTPSVLAVFSPDGPSLIYTDGTEDVPLMLHDYQTNEQRRIKVERESQSDVEGPSSFDAGADLQGDSSVTNRLIVVEIPLEGERQGGWLGGPMMSFSAGAKGIGLESLGATRGMSPTLGAEAGVLSAGSRQGPIPDLPAKDELERDEGAPVQIMVLDYVATDEGPNPVLARALAKNHERLLKDPMFRGKEA